MINRDKRLRSEEELQLNLCRLSFNNEQKIRIKDLTEEVNDWDYFIRLANKHGIVSLVFHNLEKLELISTTQENARNTLQELHLKSLARNTFLLEKYIELQKILAEIDIDPVVLKGMALEPSVYGNKGLRQMTDIDIYIAGKDDCLKAWKHLAGYGYISRPLKSKLYNKILTDFGKHLPDLYKDGISIDLHYELFDIDHQIETMALKTDRSGLTVPAYVIHFLFLAKHLAEHELRGESQLRLYIDLLQIILNPNVNITSYNTIKLAEKLGLKNIIFEKLYLLNLFWSVPVGKTILDQLSVNQKSKATDAFIAFLRNPKGHSGVNRGTSYRKTLRNIPTLRKKLIFLLGDIFPSVSFMQNRYNTRTRAGACFYYPLRLGKLLLLFIR